VSLVPRSRPDEEEEESPTALDNALRDLAGTLSLWEPVERGISRPRRYRYYVVCFDSETGRTRTALPVPTTVVRELIETLFGLGKPTREVPTSESSIAEADLQSVIDSSMLTHDCTEQWRKAFDLPSKTQNTTTVGELKGILKRYFPSIDSADSVEWVRAERDGE